MNAPFLSPEELETRLAEVLALVAIRHPDPVSAMDRAMDAAVRIELENDRKPPRLRLLS